jgi:hypothetical protein
MAGELFLTALNAESRASRACANLAIFIANYANGSYEDSDGEPYVLVVILMALARPRAVPSMSRQAGDPWPGTASAPAI